MRNKKENNSYKDSEYLEESDQIVDIRVLEQYMEEAFGELIE